MPAETITLAQLASEAYNAFRHSDPDKGERADIVLLRDDRPEWVYDLVYAAHGSDFLPDDWRYASIRSALGAIADDEPDDLDDFAGEWCDQNVDVYAGARLQWLASNLNRMGYCDDAVDKGLIEPDAGIAEHIGIGQYMESREVFAAVQTALEDELEARVLEGIQGAL